MTRALRLFSCSFAIFSLALLAACGGGSDSSTPATSAAEGPASTERPINLSQGSDVLTMDPYFKNESPTIAVLMNIFDPLTDVDHDLKLVPGLAESWESKSPLLWEFKLREGVKFHNGQDFDAEDVRYSIIRARDWPQSRQKAEVATIKEIKIVDPHTVHFEMAAPDSVLPKRLISVFMIDKETTEAGIAKEGDSFLGQNPNGTGAYKLKEWIKDSHCLLEANESHWRGAPEVKQIRFLAVSNDNTRIAKFLSGEIDILGQVPVRDVERVKSTPGYSVIEQPSLRLIYLGLDTGRDKTPGVSTSPPNPLKDIRVRQAIYAAINEDLIIEKVMHGHAVAAGQLFPEGVVGYVPEIQREPYDLQKARRLMSEAGYDRGFQIRLDAPNDRYVNDAQIAQAIASQLAQINIMVAPNAMPKARFFPEEEEGNFSFFLIGWTNPNGDGYGTFDHLLHTMDAEKNLGGANTSTNYSNPEVDRLTEAAAAEFDPAKREQLLQEAVRIVMLDLPHIPLHFQTDIYAISNRVEWRPRRDVQMRGIDMKWKN